MIKVILKNSIAYIFSLLLFTHSTWAAEVKDFPGIQQLMSVEQFANAGLNKLSPAEVEALNQWLTEYTANEASVVKSRSVSVKKAAKEEKVQAKIVGEFEGWTGDTVFHLDNGQIWKQRLRGRYRANTENPEIVITKNWMGFYRLTIVSSGRSVGVKRVK